MAVDFDVYTPFGTTPENSTEVFQDEWNLIGQAFTGDGTIGELTAALTGRMTFTASGSDKNLIITPNGSPGVMAAGHTGKLTGAKSINIDAGGAPGVGVRRIDWVVARVDRTAQKLQLDVVTGSPGTGVPPSLEMDRGGDLEVPLAMIDRTGPVNLTNAMITVTSLRPAPGWFAGTALDSTLRDAIAIPDGGFLIQGYEIYVSVQNSGGTAMELRPLFQPPWANLTLATGYSYPTAGQPQYRVINGALEMRGIVRRSSGTWTAGTAVDTLATFPLSVKDALGQTTNWTRHSEQTFYSTGLTVVSRSTVRIAMTNSGGVISLPEIPANSLACVELDGIRVFPNIP